MSDVHADSITIEERCCRGELGAPKRKASHATIPVNGGVIDRVHRLKTVMLEIKAGIGVRRYPAVKSCRPGDLVFASVAKGVPCARQGIRLASDGGHALMLEKDHRRFQHEVLSFFDRP